MECEQIKKIIPFYLDHTAREEEISLVEEHLCICNNCREYLNKILDKPSQILHSSEKNVKSNLITVKKQLELLDYVILLIALAVLIAGIYFVYKK